MRANEKVVIGSIRMQGNFIFICNFILQCGPGAAGNISYINKTYSFVSNYMKFIL